MWGIVLWFALAAAQDPVRIGIAGVLISRPRPMHHLFVYWLGLMVTGFGAALVALFLLRDFTAPLSAAISRAFSSPIVPPIQVALGVLALSGAALLARRTPARQPAPAAVSGAPGGEGAVLVEESPKPNPFFGRFSWTSLLERRSLGMAFVAGLCTSTQLVEFSGAMVVILASGAAAGTQVSAALVFTLIAFAICEVPLVGHLISPARTQAAVMGLHTWLNTHRRKLMIVVLIGIGTWLISTGVGML
jgi:Sap, sulfolipid-1-addressing protein